MQRERMQSRRHVVRTKDVLQSMVMAMAVVVVRGVITIKGINAMDRRNRKIRVVVAIDRGIVKFARDL